MRTTWYRGVAFVQTVGFWITVHVQERVGYIGSARSPAEARAIVDRYLDSSPTP